MTTWETILEIVRVVTPVAIAWIAYKQHQQSRDMRNLEKNTNSMKDELVRITGESSRAQGNLEGRAEQKAENAK